MQSMNEKDEVVQTDIFEGKEGLEQIAPQILLSRRKGAVKHLIGELPKKGSIVKTENGLRFEVKFVDYKRGEVRLKLVGLVKGDV